MRRAERRCAAAALVSTGAPRAMRHRGRCVAGSASARLASIADGVAARRRDATWNLGATRHETRAGHASPQHYVVMLLMSKAAERPCS